MKCYQKSGSIEDDWRDYVVHPFPGEVEQPVGNMSRGVVSIGDPSGHIRASASSWPWEVLVWMFVFPQA